MAQEIWAAEQIGVDGQIKIVFEQHQDAQFIGFNLGFPFPAPFGRFYFNLPAPDSGIITEATIVYGKGANPYAVFQQAATEFGTPDGEAAFGIFPAFLRNLVFPAEAEALHAQRIQDAHDTVPDMGLDAQKSAILQG